MESVYFSKESCVHWMRRILSDMTMMLLTSKAVKICEICQKVCSNWRHAYPHRCLRTGSCSFFTFYQGQCYSLSSCEYYDECKVSRETCKKNVKFFAFGSDPPLFSGKCNENPINKIILPCLANFYQITGLPGNSTTTSTTTLGNLLPTCKIFLWPISNNFFFKFLQIKEEKWPRNPKIGSSKERNKKCIFSLKVSVS